MKKTKVFLYHYITFDKIATFESIKKASKKLELSYSKALRYIRNGTLINDEYFITDIDYNQIDFEI